mmetsp:Transcript_16361/g.46775  ORF Transcript_16361/g.46775 Transcript_16361/m.46775 type:complete len:127 (+) Transcript_16361:114-494(+)
MESGGAGGDNILVPLAAISAVLAVAIFVLFVVKRTPPSNKSVPLTLVVDRASIERLFPEVRLTAPADSCAVCLVDMQTHEPCRQLQCSHLFHADCIDRWFLRGVSTMVCPTCRRTQCDGADVECSV